MTGQHPVIAFDLAHSHQDTMLQRAELKRLNDLAAEQSDESSLRRRVGLSLVRIGEHLATRRRDRITTAGYAGDRAVSAGVLRLSR